MKIFFKHSMQNMAILLMVMLFAAPIYSQGPNTPEAGAFEPIDATDMVNLLTGDMTYVLPLLNVPSPEGGYPITLSYHAGIGMEQEASWVGLGWNLNPGAINRGVNGYPDDWNRGVLIERFYDDGGGESESTITTSYNGYGLYFANSYTYNSNKGFGGSVSAGYGGLTFTAGIQPGGKFSGNLGVGLGSSNGFSMGASIGTQGWGLNAGYQSMGIRYNQSFSGSSAFSLLYSANGSSVGISFSSNNILFAGNSFGINMGQNLNLNHSNSMVAFHVETVSKGFDLSIPTPIGIFGLGYGSQKIKWDKNVIKEDDIGGAYYLSESDNIYTCVISLQNSTGDPETYTTTVFDAADCNCGLIDEIIKYNDYTCLSATFTTVTLNHPDATFMDIYEIGDENETQSSSDNNAAFPAYDNYSVAAQGLSGSMAPVQFQNGALMGLPGRNFDNAFPGLYSFWYERGGPGVENYTNFTRDVNFQFQNEYSTSLYIEQYDFEVPPNVHNIFYFLDDDDGPNETAPRKRSGNFVQSFTNAQILNDETPGLIKPLELNIPDEGISSIKRIVSVMDGIGAFMITTPDGRTYHYSLPVYNHETLTRTWDVNGKPERKSYFESQQLKPYATHWLLTAVTGPDYIDLNNNALVDKDDYGYWVDFQYGKWSDAYVWKTPYGKEFEEDEINHSKTNTHGRKQLYYLDRIKTRTHTALFIKNSRKFDNFSEPWTYKAIDPTDLDPDPSTFDTPLFSIPEQKSLRLDKIILLKNEDDLINKDYGSGLENEGSEDINFYHYKENITAYYHLQDNIIDVNDNIDAVEDRAIKIIDFSQHYNYALVNDAPNSLLGKLTLNGLTFLEKGGVQILPSYGFEYGHNRDFDIDHIDDWGYYRGQSTTWSLTQITTPIGGKINITYEPDSYGRVAAQNGRSFTHKLKFTFITEPPKNYCNWNDIPCIMQAEKGVTRIKIEVDDQDPSAQGLILADYFDPSKPFFMDMWYSAVFNHWSSGYDRSSVDITSEFATIVELNTSQNYVIVDVLASCPAFRDYFQHSAEPVSVLNAGGDYAGVVNKNDGRYEMAWDDQSDYAYTLRFNIIGNKSPIVDSGFRVSMITTSDDLGNEMTTKYEYLDPNTNETSGVISYYPFKENSDIQVPYGSLLPPPLTMYEYVTVENIIGTNPNSDYLTKTVYKFNVLEDKNPNEIKFGDHFEIDSETLFDVNGNIYNSPDTYSANAEKTKIIDNLASLGQLLEISNYNKYGHLINRTTNQYLSKNEISQGITQESFQTYKEIRPFENTLPFKKYLRLNSSSMVKYPSVLKSTSIVQGGFMSTTNYIAHDPNTGQVLETQMIGSDGSRFKFLTVPAYTKYAAMGSKVDDINYANMLVQNGINYTLLEQNGNWVPIGVGIQTWNNNWNYIDAAGEVNSPSDPTHKIWRKHKAFTWDGEIAENGAYLEYDYALSNDDGFDWTLDSNPDPNFEISQPAPWKEISSINYYDNFSMPLELRDINNNFAVTKMTDSETKVLLTSNSKYGEAFFTGGEYGIDNTNWLEQQIFGKNLRSEAKSHSGNYSLKIDPTSNFYIQLKGNTYRVGRYKLSLWAHKDNYTNVRFKDPAGAVSEFNGETVMAGNWVQMNHYFNRDSQTDLDKQIKVVSNSGDIYIDDVRLHPVQSSISSYVYGEFDELTFILGTNNLGTKYQYDEAGRLVKIYEEIADTPTITGGFKLAKEYRYNYKGVTGGGGCLHEIFFSDVQQNTDFPASEARLIFATPGETIYYSMTTNRYGDSKAYGHYQVGSDEYWIRLQVGEDNRTITDSTEIPPSGILEVSVHHINKPEDHNGGDSILTLTSVDPATICIGDPEILADRNFN